MTKKVYVVTGPKGVGKSTTLATFPPVDDMSKVAVLDTEDSMSDIVELFEAQGHPFGKYIRAYDRYRADDDMLTRMAKGDIPWVGKEQKNSLVDYYDWLMATLAVTLKPGAFKYLLIDTIEPIEMAITAAVQDRKGKLGWSGVSAYGRMETEGVRPLYEGLLEGIHKTGVDTILVSSHIKPAWLDKKPVPGKVKAGGRMAVLARLSTAMFWLSHSGDNEDGAPAALVLKARIGTMSIVDGRWVPRRVLPERIPHFTWQDVDRYKREPANYVNPKPGERMSVDERDMISELLSNAQMRYMVMGAEAERSRARQGALATSTEAIEVKVESAQDKAGRLLTEGVPPPVVASQTGLPLPVVMNLRE